MQLSRLEIKGFKSFADRVTIQFDEGITGIVGPNGCGKSNIVDAMRWVLGEQKTRALRSEKMENIIFNGTKKRKPTQLAEVSLTFDNTKNVLPTEYTQVTITRRYYRSGDSEYQLNGVTCRLKDITNLFLDTGIGSDSYAIIELKMIDEILNDKENSRRQLFEEAAGIAKFKLRKNETLRKLEGTDADLERVADLLYEIDRNMKSLEKQAKQAEKYFILKKDYKRYSVALAAELIVAQRRQVEELQDKIEAEKTAKTALDAKTAEQEALLEKKKAELISHEKLLASRQKTLNEHVNKTRQYESDKKIKNERLRYLNDRHDKLKEQLEQDRQSHDRAEFSIKGLSTELEAIRRTGSEMEENLARLKQRQEEQRELVNEGNAALSQQTRELKERQEQYYQQTKKLEIDEIQLRSLRQEVERTDSAAVEQQTSLSDFDTKLQAIEADMAVKRGRFEKLEAQEKELDQEKEQLSATIDTVKDEVAKVNRTLDARQNEYNLTKSLVDNLEGFPEAIKYLKKKADWAKDTPLLSDIITCSPDYRAAIENYLEPYMNYYVVESEAQAMQAVSMLVDASKGKANFFLLDRFRSLSLSDGMYPPGCTSALDITEYDERYADLFRYLLHNVYVCDGPQENLPSSPDNIILSRDARMIRRPLSISGGSVGLFEGKRLGRAKNLVKLQEEIKESSARIGKLQKQLERDQRKLQELKANSKRQDLEVLRNAINSLGQQEVSLRTRKEQSESLLASSADRKQDLATRIENLEQELLDLRPKVEQGTAGLREQEQKVAALSEQLREQGEELSERSQAYNQENITFIQHTNRVKNLEQEIGFKTNTMQAAKSRMAKNREELEKIDADIKKLLQTGDFDEDTLVALYEEKESIEQGVNEAEKAYYAARGEIDSIDKGIKDIQRQREQANTLIMELQHRMGDLKIALNSVKERISVEFEVDVEDVEVDPALSDFSEEQLKEKVTNIKAQMERLGNINPMAMEAYNEVQERHRFITEQKEDLQNAKTSLLETISEIDTVAKTTFLDAFEKIKTNFKEVFTSLFEAEDTCDLLLTDPDNPLDSRIDIMAKPKGKRPLSINQLSGGEKTLTATALLFAIYLLKPAPFCIFDEVDAPLDDANIDKFNNIIRKFSKESQFIIVTHNKRTMASTDIIYGITMVEQGVSRVVPVDLRGLEETVGI